MSDDAFAKWVPVTAADIEAFLGFMILMGINRLPALEITGAVTQHIIMDQLLTASPEINSLKSCNISTLWTVQKFCLAIIQTMTEFGK